MPVLTTQVAARLEAMCHDRITYSKRTRLYQGRSKITIPNATGILGIQTDGAIREGPRPAIG